MFHMVRFTFKRLCTYETYLTTTLPTLSRSCGLTNAVLIPSVHWVELTAVRKTRMAVDMWVATRSDPCPHGSLCLVWKAHIDTSFMYHSLTQQALFECLLWSTHHARYSSRSSWCFHSGGEWQKVKLVSYGHCKQNTANSVTWNNMNPTGVCF